MEEIKEVDAVILAVAHEGFKSIDMDKMDSLYADGNKVLIDIKGILKRKQYEDAGYCYWRL